MMKESPVCSRELLKRRNLKGLMDKSRASKIAKSILALGSGKNLISSNSNHTKQESGCCFAKSLVMNYENFKKTGAPSRLMFFCTGSWNDFPESVFGSLREGFVARKPTVEVVMEGLLYLVDFFRMMLIDLKFGRQRSIAWIDENGGCFFPKLVVDGSEIEGKVSPNLKLEIELRIRNESGSEGNNVMTLDPELEIPKNKDKLVCPTAELAVDLKSNDMIMKKVKSKKIDKGEFFANTGDVKDCGISLKRKRSPSSLPEEQIDESHVNDLQTHKRFCMDRSGESLASIELSGQESSTTSSCTKKKPKEVARSSLPAMQLPHIGSSMTIPNLFSQLGKFLPLSRIGELEHLYASYKAGRISKNFLIRQVRSIAGDKVLISAIQIIRKQI